MSVPMDGNYLEEGSGAISNNQIVQERTGRPDKSEFHLTGRVQHSLAGLLLGGAPAPNGKLQYVPAGASLNLTSY